MCACWFCLYLDVHALGFSTLQHPQQTHNTTIPPPQQYNQAQWGWGLAIAHIYLLNALVAAVFVFPFTYHLDDPNQSVVLNRSRVVDFRVLACMKFFGMEWHGKINQ